MVTTETADKGKQSGPGFVRAEKTSPVKGLDNADGKAQAKASPSPPVPAASAASAVPTGTQGVAALPVGQQSSALSNASLAPTQRQTLARNVGTRSGNGALLSVLEAPSVATSASPYDAATAADVARAVALSKTWNQFLAVEKIIGLSRRGEGQIPLADELARYDLEELARISVFFEQEYSVTLRRYLIQNLNRNTVLVDCLGVLQMGNRYEEHIRLGRALIPQGTREAEVETVLRRVPLEQRRGFFQELYNDAFKGVGLTANDTLVEHLKDDLDGFAGQGDWLYKKSMTLLRRDLTDADELYFATVAIIGAHQETVLDILEKTWNGGLEAYHQLRRDWIEKVCPEYGITKSFDDVVRSELSEPNLGMAMAYIDAFVQRDEADSQYRKMAPGINPYAATVHGDRIAEIDLNLQKQILQIEANRATGSSNATEQQRITRAVERSHMIGTARYEHELREHGDGPRAKQLLEERDRADQEMAAKVATIDGDDVARMKALAAGPLTLADEIYFAANRKAPDHEKIIEKATMVWVRGPEARIELFRDAAVTKPFRPSFDPTRPISLSMGTIRNVRRFESMLPLSLETFRDGGARRLGIELDGYWMNTASADLRSTVAFLRQMSQAQRDDVVSCFMEKHRPAAEAGTDSRKVGQAFMRYLRENRGFEFSDVRLDIEDLVMGAPTSDDDTLDRAEMRQKAAHTGVLSRVADGLVGIHDTLSGDDTLGVEREAMERLRYIVAKAKASPEDLQLLIKMTGTGSTKELAKLASSDLMTALKAMQEVQGIMTELAGTIVDVGLRSILVAIAGTGVGALGIGAAWIAIGSGIALREGLRGANYDAISKENISNLAGELFTGALDAQPFEALLKAKISPGLIQRISPNTSIIRAEQWSAFVGDGLYNATSKIGEKFLQNLIEDKDLLPTASELGFRAANNLVLNGSKALLRPLLKNATALDENATHLFKNYVSTVLGGPPNGMALPAVVMKKLKEMMANPSYNNMTTADIASVLVKGLLTSVISAGSVSTSISHTKLKSVSAIRELLKKEPEVVKRLMLADPTFKKSYDAYVAHAKNEGTAALNEYDWLIHHIDRQEKSYLMAVPPPGAPASMSDTKVVRTSEQAATVFGWETKRRAAAATTAARAPAEKAAKEKADAKAAVRHIEETRKAEARQAKALTRHLAEADVQSGHEERVIDGSHRQANLNPEEERQ